MELLFSSGLAMARRGGHGPDGEGQGEVWQGMDTYDCKQSFVDHILGGKSAVEALEHMLDKLARKIREGKS